MNDWELDGNKNRWVPPSDRHLALLAKLKVGWSNRAQIFFAANSNTSAAPSSSSGKGASSRTHEPVASSPIGHLQTLAQGYTDDELAHIKFVLAKADRMERQEQERIGRMVDKVDRLKRTSVGDGVNDCLVCGTEFGVFGTRNHAAPCQDCRKLVCQKTCGVELLDGEKRPIFVCRLCNEERETWKKSGAWFYHGMPKHVLPQRPRPVYDEDDSDDSRAAAAAGFSSRPPPSPRRRNGRDHPDQPPQSSARTRPQPESPRRNVCASASMPDEAGPPSSMPQPRWATTESEDTRRRRESHPVSPPAKKTISDVNDRYYSSSDEDEEIQAPRPKVSSSGQYGNRNQQSQQQQQRQRMANDSDRSYSDERLSDEDGGGRGRVRGGSGAMLSNHSLASHHHASPNSVQSPMGATADTAMYDGSDSKSVDSGVVRGEQSPVRRPSGALLPSSPSFGPNTNHPPPPPPATSNGTAEASRRPPPQPQPQKPVVPSMQPLAPTFRTPIHMQQSDLNVGSVAAASRRASVAAVERMVDKMNMHDDSSRSPRMDHRFSLTCVSEVSSGLQPMSPDLPSSPDDEHSSLGTLEFSVLYDTDNQTLTLSIIRAINLRSMDKNGFSDPYVKTYLLPGAAKSTKLRTRTVRKTLNPEWNENLVYYGITDEDRMKKTLRLTVLDEDRIGADFLGETRVPLKRIVAGKEKTFSVYLERQLPVEKQDEQVEGRGKILLSLMYDNEKQRLLVEVIRCAELIGMDPNGYSDPYVKLALIPDNDKKHQVKTKTKKKTLNPVFNENFSIPIPLAELTKKSLDVTVWDYDVGKHDDFIGGVQLGIDAKGDRLKHWYDCMKNPGNTFQRWHKLGAEQSAQSSSGT